MLNKRNIFRDFCVYTISSVVKLLVRGKVSLFLTDILFFLKWRKYRDSKTSILLHEIPWLNFKSIYFLEKYLKKDMKVFEFGSGGSTIYFSRLVEKVISVEHSNDWYSQTNDAILALKLCNIEYLFCEPSFINTTSTHIDCKDPKNYKSCLGQYTQYDFQNYATSIDRYSDEYFDLVVVDGRARASCILHSIKKIKKNGILFIDNSDRNYYIKPFNELQDKKSWKELNFVGHFPFGSASVLSYSKGYIKLI
jgi:hypothetical protein